VNCRGYHYDASGCLSFSANPVVVDCIQTASTGGCTTGTVPQATFWHTTIAVAYQSSDVSLFPYKPGSTGDPTNGVIPTSASHGGLSTGAEIGIGVGAGLGALLLVLLAGVFCVCTRRKKKHTQLAQLGNVPPVDEKPPPSTNVAYKGQESPNSPGAYSSNRDSIYSGMSDSTFRPDTAPIYPQPISETLYVMPPGMHPIQHPVAMMPGYVPYQHPSPTHSPPAAELEGTYGHPTALGPVVNTWNIPNPSQGHIQYSPHGETSP
jgi:hypothetical protein